MMINLHSHDTPEGPAWMHHRRSVVQGVSVVLGVILNNQRPGVVRYPTWIMRRALKRVQGNDGRLEPPQVVISGASRCFNEEAAAVDDGKT